MRRLTPIALVLMACVGFTTFPRANADSAGNMQTYLDSRQALGALYMKVPGSRDLKTRAKGVLVFPKIVKAGSVEGVLLTGGEAAVYYTMSAASVGLQAAEPHSMVVMFMTPTALRQFEDSNGWDVGADASAAIIKTGADVSRSVNKPVNVFVYGQSGLMGDLSLEGTRISKLE
jgi:lipid-binding SYLF domain-containing protein